MTARQPSPATDKKRQHRLRDVAFAARCRSTFRCGYNRPAIAPTNVRHRRSGSVIGRWPQQAQNKQAGSSTLCRNLYDFRDFNWSVPAGLLGPSGFHTDGTPLTINERKPYPNFGVIQLVHEIGYGNYNAPSLKVTKRYSVSVWPSTGSTLTIRRSIGDLGCPEADAERRRCSGVDEFHAEFKSSG